MLKGVTADVRPERVALAGREGEYIHTLRVQESPDASSKAAGRSPIVLIHGYFMGAASWAASFDSLAKTGREVLSIDWPGSGRSSKPSFPHRGGVDACEDFFVEHIEAWRRSLGLERMALLGHSFGGYFAACYTMRYPQHVESLILASPVGMGEKTPGGRFSPEKRTELPMWQRGLVSSAESAWEGYYTPQALVRFLGPFGGRLTRWYVNRRFTRPREAGTMSVDGEAMAEYMHQLAAQPGCSELCLGELLEFGAWAKRPLAPRLAARLIELGPAAPPVTLIYGEHDWMDPSQGAWLAAETGKGRTRRDPDGEVIVVEGAGHQMFVDNPNAFNAAVHRVFAAGPPAASGLYRRFSAA